LETTYLAHAERKTEVFSLKYPYYDHFESFVFLSYFVS